MRPRTDPWEDDDDDDDDDDKLFMWNGWPARGVKPYFHSGPLSEILTIANHTPRAGFEYARNLGSDCIEWSCAVLITTTPRRYIRENCFKHFGIWNKIT